MAGLIPYPQKRTKLTVYDENNILIWVKEIDLVVSAQHEKEMLITDHPTSEGIPVTDNVKAKPRMLPVLAIFTDFPAAPDEIVKKLLSAETAQDVYDQLDEIMDKQAEGWHFKVETTRRTYENMLLQKMTNPVTNEKAQHVELMLLFKEVRKATSRTSEIQKPKRKTNQQKQTKGAQAKAKPPPEKASTVAFKIQKAGEKLVAKGVEFLQKVFK